jgi:uncharacterized protein (TIGR02646 family)
MIRLRPQPLSAKSRQALAHYQDRVNKHRAYANQVAAAKAEFTQRNKATNPAFREVRKLLSDMSAGARRCHYCEDNRANQVEHFKPKDLYPEAVFDWDNYLYACGPCNGPKNNKFAVFAAGTGRLTDVGRRPKAPVAEPPGGKPALINPRTEDPFRFMRLDLLGTFRFVPLGAKRSRGYRRAEYTITLLNLNDDEVLAVARAGAYGEYRARLSEYITVKKAGASAARLNELRRGIIRNRHPTVWREIQRQWNLVPEFKKLFAQVPEAKSW